MKNIKLIVFIIVLFLLGGFVYYYEVIPNKEKLEDNTINEIECTSGYTCETIDKVSYEWTKKDKISVINVYNYDTDAMVSGTLEIVDDILVFVDSENNEIMEYDYIDGKVTSVEVSTESCADEFIYLILTDKGKIYVSDYHNGILANKAFGELNRDSLYSNFMVKLNKTDYLCSTTEIYAKTKDNKVEKFLVNENVISE